MAYNVGQGEIDIIPSFKGVADAIDAEAAKWGESAGGKFADAFSARVTEETKDTPLGPSDEESTEKGDSAGGKFADAFKARVDAALKSLPNAEITADSSQADRKIADIRAELETLRNQDIGVDITDTDALAKLAKLKTALAAVGASSDSIRIKIDTSGAVAEITALEAAINGADGNLTKLGSDASSAGGGISNLVTAAAGIGPALIPITAVAAAGLQSVATMALAAGAGLGAFALAGYNDLGRLESVLELTLADFQQLAAPTVLPVIDNALGLVLPIFSDLIPLVDSTATELTKLENAGKSALDDPFWRGFVTFLASEAGPSIATFSNLIGGFGKAFAGLSVAFGPVIAEVEADVDGFSNHLAAWASNLGSNQGFQNFLAYVEREAPVVGHFLENLGGDVSGLLSDLAPAGRVVLDVITNLTGFLKVLEEIHAGPINFPELALLGVGFAKLAPLVVDAGKALQGFALSAAIATGGEELGPLTGALGSLGETLAGLSIGLPEIAIGAAAVFGAFYLLNSGGIQLTGTWKNLVDSIEKMPTSTLPELNAAIGATKAELDSLNGTTLTTAQRNEDAAQSTIAITDAGEQAAGTYLTLTAYLKKLDDQQSTYRKNVDTLSQSLGLSSSSVVSLAQSINVPLTKALLTAPQIVQFSAALQQQAAQAGLTGLALQRLASTSEESASKIATDVTTATQAATTAWASYGNAVTAFSSSTTTVAGKSIAAFYTENEAQGAQFAANIQKAIADGYNPQLIEQILQAGPAQASQLLQGLVNAQGTGLNNLITSAMSAMSKEGIEAVQEARLTQEAISAQSSATTAQLGSALSISQALTTSNVQASVQTVINGLSGGYTEFLQICTNYSIALPAALQAQLDAANTAGHGQGTAAGTGLESSDPAGWGSSWLAGALGGLTDGGTNKSAAAAGAGAGLAFGDAAGAAIVGAIVNEWATLGSILRPFAPPIAAPASSAGPPTGKAAGGPVSAGTPYLIGEVGPEVFVPNVAGHIIPNSQLTVPAAVSVGAASRSGPVQHVDTQIIQTQADADAMASRLAFLSRSRRF